MLESPPSTELRQSKILLVEDHADVGEVTMLMLKRLGYIAQRVATVSTAVETFKRERFDVLIVDYQLPDGTGFDVIERIGQGPHRTILMTGYGKDELEDWARHGFSKVLRKPADIQMLAEALK